MGPFLIYKILLVRRGARGALFDFSHPKRIVLSFGCVMNSGRLNLIFYLVAQFNPQHCLKLALQDLVYPTLALWRYTLYVFLHSLLLVGFPGQGT